MLVRKRLRTTLLAVLLALLLGLALVPSSTAVPQAKAAAAGTFRNPLNSGPDPYTTHFRGNYYLTTTQGGSIRMWRSPFLVSEQE